MEIFGIPIFLGFLLWLDRQDRQAMDVLNAPGACYRCLATIRWSTRQHCWVHPNGQQRGQPDDLYPIGHIAMPRNP
jgi:hypothetical protein